MAKQQHHVPCPVCHKEFLVPVGAMIMAEQVSGHVEPPESKGALRVWWENDTPTGILPAGEHVCTPESGEDVSHGT